MNKYLIFIVLSIILFGCKTENERKKSPEIKNGFIDLSRWNFTEDGSVELRGEWNFYWSRFLNQQELNKLSPTPLKVPGTWNNLVINNNKLSGKGYGTFHTRCIIPRTEHHFGIKLMTTFTAANVYLNGKNIGKLGKTGETKQLMQPEYNSKIMGFFTFKDTIDVIIHVSNFHHKKGGFRDPVKIGHIESLNQERQSRLYLEFFMVGAILIMALYHFGLYFSRMQNKAPVHFAFFCLWIAIRMMVTGEYPIFLLLKLKWEFIVAIEYISFYLSSVSFTTFIYSLFPEVFKKWFNNMVQIAGYSLTLLTVVTPATIYTETAVPFQIFVVLICLYIIYVLIVSIKQNRQGAGSIVMGFLLMFASIVNDILYANNALNTIGNMTTYGLFLFIFSQAFVLVIRFTAAYRNAEILSIELDHQNKNLEVIVQQRTEKINNQKEVIEKSHKEIKDSINYARRIQSAIFPSEIELERNLKHYFVLFKPKDVVSGDFYWFRKIDNNIIVSVADCTGHGVPGAFMSMLGIALLNEIVRDDENLQASVILDNLREKVKASLRQTGKRSEQKDGIDIAMCIINSENKNFQFAGAHQPVYVIRNKELPDLENIDNEKIIEYGDSKLMHLNSDPQPIGVFVKESPFRNYESKLFEGDRVYLFSDGFSDQLGGEKERKFRSGAFKKLLLDIHKKDFNTQKDILNNTFESYKSDKFKQMDDILVLGFQIV
jgi:serine phosphatase RsbU (regulator of sigma subunit)